MPCETPDTNTLVILSITDHRCKRRKRLSRRSLIDHRQPSMFPSRYVTNSPRPLSDVTNLLSSKTRADSTIERDNRTSTLASMTSIRHTFNFYKNSVTHVENVRLDESCDTQYDARSKESMTAFVMHGRK